MDDLAKQIADLNRNIEKLTAAMTGLITILAAVRQATREPIRQHPNDWYCRVGAGVAVDPRSHVATMTGLADIGTNVQTY